MIWGCCAKLINAQLNIKTTNMFEATGTIFYNFFWYNTIVYSKIEQLGNFFYLK
jgi:hypothetical protein